MSLHLEPNELVGYRIKPDWNSYNVVQVKRHGPSSKNAGQEYDTPLAYCKHLESAAKWIFSHVVRTRGELHQKELAQATGSIASAEGLQKAFEEAQSHTFQAISELQARIDNLGLSRKQLVQALGSTDGST